MADLNYVYKEKEGRSFKIDVKEIAASKVPEYLVQNAKNI